MKQKEQNCKHTVMRMEYGIENRMAIFHLQASNETKHFIRSLQTILVVIFVMTLISGCAASLTDFGYEGGPTTTVIPNKRINDGYGEPREPFFGFDGKYDPKLTIYYPYSGTFSSSRQYGQK